ncbi:chemotaxis response regulator protein-glutamate methylesterase [Enterovibrio norvegicus]|uniref:protein-glutamate methylesterase/protein-glutamine glutaminase n=1 Tax=Enterovibrio norvegicus TaxID=188144 RepID=UPI0002D85B17|nr:chemotaxis response regulator protein-glutamate methylesterase [Enterovibrio norvegicus]MCC4801097.1 chemotaxis response regulator protein-glutamate methylesterase [Enterovibrio norvegicus]OEE42925.1 chemotaxis response regulator protein-glutamate methylesterase [Enterovibrio norvegicus]PMH72769.1 chemotaxis response regulator protein-glutamate methylesterase [Enterovibrio norvegicus]PMI27348.1 chemotaxis response regulator protein-glutamate methylesterase [Enterovibrio norvegicus]PMI36511.
MKKRAHKVLIVDDSAVFRALLSDILDADPQLDVVGLAVDPYEAREKIKKLKPDVITLDIEMPKMDGVQFLRNLMRLHPMPVVMISTLTQHGAEATLAALEIGAVDYFPKPTDNVAAELNTYRQLVVEKVKMAATANIAGAVHKPSGEISVSGRQLNNDIDIIGIGASTGGTEAIRNVLEALPELMPPIVITQHIKAVFSKSFSERLNRASKLTVEELATGKAPLINGRVYVAPGDVHMKIIKKGGRYYCTRCDSEPVQRHKPSVDVMFSSIAQAAGKRAMSVLLTGMGRDGAQGMLEMRQQGAITVAQDEHSSVVWGMPRAAIELEAAQHVLPLDKIATYLVGKAYG